MKKLPYLLIALVIVMSCSDDDNSDSTPIIVDEVIDYFPLSPNTYWTYNNESEEGPTRDSLYVAGASNSYTMLEAREPKTGFMISLLSQSLVRATDTELILKGELGTPPVDGFPEISIPLNDVALYNTEASNGEVLDVTTGEIEQTIQDIPLVIGYTITTKQGEVFENGYGDFTDRSVIKSYFIVNLSIAANIEIVPGTVLTIPVLEAQDVITTTNYYAENIGLINSDTLIEYELEDLSGIGVDLPIPQQDSRTATQDIDTYFIGN